jgi:ribosome-associated protein
VNLNSLPPDLRAAITAAQNKLAFAVVVLDLRELRAFTNFFLICSAASSPQVQAIHNEVEHQLEKLGRRATQREGYNAGQWVLMDYGNFVVHIFSEQGRVFYDLERLWRNAKRFEIPVLAPAQRTASQP